MRVLLSAFACEPGGGSEGGKAWAWAERLAEDHDVTVITDASFSPRVTEELSRQPMRRLTFVFHGTGPPGYEGMDIYPYYYAWQREILDVARRLHAATPFDVAHHISYGMHRVPSYLWRLPIPFIWGPVGGGEQVPLTFASPRWLGMREAAMEWIRAAWNAAVRVDPRVRACAGGATVPVATTDETRRTFPREVRDRTVVLRNSVVSPADRERLARRRPQPPGATGARCLFAGRLLGWKGPTLALAAFARYAQAYPDATLDIVGDGPLEARLVRDARRLGLADRVTVHGRIARDELLDRYPDHQVFLFPSMHDSGGTVAGEAMAAGLPVVCLDAGGVGAYVPADAGVKVAPHTPRQAVRDLATGLAVLTDDTEAWRRASDAAFDAARDPAVDPPLDERIKRLYSAAGVL